MGNLEFKNIILVILVIICVGLTLGIIFKPNNTINYNEDVIRALKVENIRLLSKNDSIKVSNNKLSHEIDSLGQMLYDMGEDLNDTKAKIKKLKIKKDEISNHIDTIGGDELTRVFTDFLNRKE
tara:strand:+ start:2908 stop:3279 length:372 start_codon:yes stop_codon:yes gene_type:complete